MISKTTRGLSNYSQTLSYISILNQHSKRYSQPTKSEEKKTSSSSSSSRALVLALRPFLSRSSFPSVESLPQWKERERQSKTLNIHTLFFSFFLLVESSSQLIRSRSLFVLRFESSRVWNVYPHESLRRTPPPEKERRLNTTRKDFYVCLTVWRLTKNAILIFRLAHEFNALLQ